MSVCNLTFQRQICSQADYYSRQYETGSTFSAEELLAACYEDSLAHKVLPNSILHQAESIKESPLPILEGTVAQTARHGTTTRTTKHVLFLLFFLGSPRLPAQEYPVYLNLVPESQSQSTAL